MCKRKGKKSKTLLFLIYDYHLFIRKKMWYVKSKTKYKKKLCFVQHKKIEAPFVMWRHIDCHSHTFLHLLSRISYWIQMKIQKKYKNKAKWNIFLRNNLHTMYDNTRFVYPFSITVHHENRLASFPWFFLYERWDIGSDG